MTAVRRQPERAEQAAIVKLLRTIGAAVYVVGTTRRAGDHPGTMMSPGLCDVIAFLPAPSMASGSATLAMIEVKAQGGRLRPEQRVFKVHCESASVPHIVGGLDAVIAFLECGGWLKAPRAQKVR